MGDFCPRANLKGQIRFLQGLGVFLGLIIPPRAAIFFLSYGDFYLVKRQGEFGKSKFDEKGRFLLAIHLLGHHILKED